MRKLKIAAAVVLAAAVSVIASCHNPERESVNIYVSEKNSKGEINDGFYDKVKAVQRKYPYINPIPVSYPNYNYTTRYNGTGAELYEVLRGTSYISSANTEFEELVLSGYTADLTEAFRRTGLDKKINPDWLDFITKDGKIYAIPYQVYVQGLCINKELFTQAGLVNEDGSIKYPKTYDELAEYADIIRKKTGAAGFGIASAGNYGGWQLMNIAWSFGVDFVKKDFKGNWVASFNSPEFIDTLQYLRDLKWKYDTIPENLSMDNANLLNRFAANKLAMMIHEPSSTNFANHKIPLDNIMVVSMPKGPAGAYAQMGGNMYYLNSDSSEEEIDACILYMIETNMLRMPRNEADYFEFYEQDLKNKFERGAPVLERDPIKIWLEGSEAEKCNEIRKKYVNTDYESYEKYFAFDDVIIRAEEPIGSQELYKLLDTVIVEVYSNPDADFERLAAETADKFQREYLDVINQNE